MKEKKGFFPSDNIYCDIVCKENPLKCFVYQKASIHNNLCEFTTLENRFKR